jgi:excisionase family DNA binding protein
MLSRGPVEYAATMTQPPHGLVYLAYYWPMHRLLTPTEVGELVGLKRDAIYRAIDSGELKAVRLRGRLRSREDWIDEWVQASLVRPMPRGASNKPQRSRRQLSSDSVRAQLRKERAT